MTVWSKELLAKKFFKSHSGFIDGPLELARIATIGATISSRTRSLR